MLFEKCPVCGGDVELRDIEETLRGGNNTATLKTEALVCLRCGEIMYPITTIRFFDDIKRKLETEDITGFLPMGRAYKIQKTA